MSEDCPFCSPMDVIAETTHFHIVRDHFPVNPGHTLVILKRHEPSALNLTREEWTDLYDAIDLASSTIDREHGTSELNIGVNIGAAAGQTIPHVHIHVIPRYTGDCENPRGGVRKVKPALADY